MCPITLSKSTEKVFFIVVTAVTVVTIVRTIIQPLHKKMFSHEKFLVTKNFSHKQILSKKNFSHKKFLVTKKILVTKFF